MRYFIPLPDSFPEKIDPNNPIIIDIWYSGDHLPQVEDAEEQVSDDVLIDLTGERETFVVGWYCFDIKVWRTWGNIDLPDSPDMKWKELPLIKYDKQ